MEKNSALTLYGVLRRRGATPITDKELCKLAKLQQWEIDLAAEELEANGMLEINRTYTLIQ